MLYLISNPMFLSAGNYACKQITSEEAAALIRHTHSTNELKSLVHFASTVAALRVLADVEVALVGRSEIPIPKDGDCFIDIRLKANTPKGRPIEVGELEFWRIDFELA